MKKTFTNILLFMPTQPALRLALYLAKLKLNCIQRQRNQPACSKTLQKARLYSREGYLAGKGRQQILESS